MDKWLWAVRAFKTRALATAACRSNAVQVNDMHAKPGRDVHNGEIVRARIGLITRTLKVRGFPKARVSANLVNEFMEDLTPAEEYEKLKRPKIERFLARDPGAGRPTKKDRRTLGRIFGFE